MESMNKHAILINIYCNNLVVNFLWILKYLKYK